MPFPIIWIIVATIAAGAAAYFLDEIKSWATQVIEYILDAINYAIEVTSDAIAYLIEQGTRVYKRLEIYVRNVRTGSTRLEYRQEEISPYDIPDEIKAELNQKQKVKLLQQST